MRTRTGFVSNSSSSSFVLDLSRITPMQLSQIKDHTREGERLAKLALDGRYATSLSEESLMWLCGMQGDGWDVTEGPQELRLHTWMDNFSMRDFFVLIGVPESAILRSGDGWD